VMTSLNRMIVSVIHFRRQPIVIASLNKMIAFKNPQVFLGDGEIF